MLFRFSKVIFLNLLYKKYYGTLFSLTRSSLESLSNISDDTLVVSSAMLEFGTELSSDDKF